MTNSYPSGSPGVPESSMPTGAPGLIPHRSSYASVVSGTGASFSQHYVHPSRIGAFDLLRHANEYHQSGRSALHDSRTNDMDTHRNGGYGGSGSWGRSGRLPSCSSAFNSLTNGYGFDAGNGGLADQFFIPSYLRGSKHVQKLEEAYRAKLMAGRDAPSTHSSQPGSLSTSNSSANLGAKLAPSHRGMTFDLIEKAPPLEDDGLGPLPSKWSSQDKHSSLEVLGDGQEVKSTGTRSSSDRDLDASSIRADHPIPPQCGIYYFEVTILSRKREESSIGIGFSSKDVSLNRPPGWEPESWAYHGDDGNSYCCQSSGKTYGPAFTAPDVIGCGINFRTGHAFFTRNGDWLGIAFREIRGKLFPSVGMRRSDLHIRVNFGHSPFVFDIDGMMLREKQLVKQQVESTSTAKLAPGLDETALIQSLVLQFLSHDGYVETAKAFANEIREECSALNLNTNVPINAFDFAKEDEDAINRQRIRTAILDGDVDKSLKLTNAFYPNVLKDNEHIYFRLRNQKFIEMVRQFSEIRSTSVNGNKKANGHGEDWYDDVINHAMELDEPNSNSNGYDKMDTENGHDPHANYNTLMEQTIQYGQVLQAEFANDPRREVSKSLKDSFALLAYEDPINEKTVAHLLKREVRVSVAEELNSAILVSLGKSSCAALERVVQQITVLVDDLRENGGPGSFINVNEYLRPPPDR